MYSVYIMGFYTCQHKCKCQGYNPYKVYICMFHLFSLYICTIQTCNVCMYHSYIYYIYVYLYICVILPYNAWIYNSYLHLYICIVQTCDVLCVHTIYICICTFIIVMWLFRRIIQITFVLFVKRRYIYLIWFRKSGREINLSFILTSNIKIFWPNSNTFLMKKEEAFSLFFERNVCRVCVW